jgi:hypothetical protein
MPYMPVRKPAKKPAKPLKKKKGAVIVPQKKKAPMKRKSPYKRK